jgi:hypothetical protein
MEISTREGRISGFRECRLGPHILTRYGTMGTTSPRLSIENNVTPGFKIKTRCSSYVLAVIKCIYLAVINRMEDRCLLLMSSTRMPR